MSKHGFTQFDEGCIDPPVHGDDDGDDFESLRKNENTGDEMSEKAAKHTRLYFKNVSGFSLQKDGGEFAAAAVGMKARGIDLLCIAESNACHKHDVVQDATGKALKQCFKHDELVMSSSDIKYKPHYKPGGTMITARGGVTGRISAQGKDACGRWCWFRINRKGKSLLVVSACQAGKKKTWTSGKSNKRAATQQFSMLCQRGRSGIHPRQAFREDLLKFLQS